MKKYIEIYRDRNLFKAFLIFCDCLTLPEKRVRLIKIGNTEDELVKNLGDYVEIPWRFVKGKSPYSVIKTYRKRRQKCTGVNTKSKTAKPSP